jgi:hypothetical protein
MRWANERKFEDRQAYRDINQHLHTCSTSAQGEEGLSWTPAKENELFIDRRLPIPFMAVEVDMVNAITRVMQAIFILVSLAGGMAMFAMSDVNFYE